MALAKQGEEETGKEKLPSPSVAWREAPHLRFVDLQKQNKCPLFERGEREREEEEEKEHEKGRKAGICTK